VARRGEAGFALCRHAGGHSWSLENFGYACAFCRRIELHMSVRCNCVRSASLPAPFAVASSRLLCSAPATCSGDVIGFRLDHDTAVCAYMRWKHRRAHERREERWATLTRRKASSISSISSANCKAKQLRPFIQLWSGSASAGAGEPPCNKHCDETNSTGRTDGVLQRETCPLEKGDCSECSAGSRTRRGKISYSGNPLHQPSR
jgi:hypothetical protein